MSNNFTLNEEEAIHRKNKKKVRTGILGLLMRIRLIKTERRANIILILFTIAGMTVIIYLNFITFAL